MTIELSRYGIWQVQGELTPEIATEVGRAGFGALWVGGSPAGDLEFEESLLAATDRLVVATDIVNMWTVPAEQAAASFHRIDDRYPGRFVLGVGIGHPEAHQEYTSPYDTIVAYLDALDAAGVPVGSRALAALGPKVLDLAAERTGIVHPYLVPPEHTRQARERIGDRALLAPEQKVVLDPDPERARAIGRPRVANPYLHLRNYVSSLERLGWSAADVAPDGSDALIDVLAVHGDAATVAAGLNAHLAAGADHVCAQILVADPADYVPSLQALAGALHQP